MKLIVDNKNKEKLIGLWQKVFGDEREYIELIFSEKSEFCDVFAISEGEEICSVLYLLDCCINIGNVVYKGKYLYAAATDVKHRKKGLMAELIKQAQSFCRDNGFDFIVLLPADEYLYGYYEKFGFNSCMYRYKTADSADITDFNEISGKEYLLKRAQSLDKSFSFCGGSIDYAVSCLEYSDCRFFTDQSGNIYLSEEGCFTEIIGPDGKLYGTEKERYGMIYCIDNNRSGLFTDNPVYMNIALD